MNLSDAEKKMVEAQRRKIKWVTFEMYTDDGAVYYVPKGQRHYIDTSKPNWSLGYQIPEGTYEVRLKDGTARRRKLVLQPVKIDYWDQSEFRGGGSGHSTASTFKYAFRVCGKLVHLQNVEIKVALSTLKRGSTRS